MNPAVRQLYQIGTQAMHTHTLSYTPGDISAGGKLSTYQDSWRVLSPSSAHKTNIRKESIEILLFADGIFSSGQIYNNLLSMIGVPVDLISYEMFNENPISQDSRIVCCQCDCCECVLQFYTAIGRVSDIKLNQKHDDYYALTITVEYITLWKPMSRAEWRYQYQGNNIFGREDFIPRITNPWSGDIEVDLSAWLEDYPTCDMLFANPCRAFRKFFYTDDWQYLPDIYRQHDCSTTRGLPSPYGTTWWMATEGGQTHYDRIIVPPDRWNAPSLSYVVIDGWVDSSDVITFTNKYQQQYNRLEYTTEIDLAVVNEIASQNTISISKDELGGEETETLLEPTDRLVIGEIEGIVQVRRMVDSIHDSVILYAGGAVNTSAPDYPFTLYPGMNRWELNSRESRVSFRHIFRRY
jgi:hypothetical protein